MRRASVAALDPREASGPRRRRALAGSAHARVGAALALLAAVGCHRAPPVTVEPVRLYVAPGLPGALVSDLARGFSIAAPTLVADPAQAEVAWLSDPVAALALGERAVAGSAPEQPGVPDGFVDPRRRWAPVGAVARVIVSAPGEAPAFAPDELRELADPRVAGQVALAGLDRREGALLAAALEQAHGERGTRGWLAQLASNRPALVQADADAVARVVGGTSAVALVDSLAAGAPLAAGKLRVTFPDQKGKGCVAIPTALVVLPGASPAARKLSAWLAGPNAEQVLVERVVGLLPLRAAATAPPGIVPAWRLKLLSPDWQRLAEQSAVWERRLAAWPTIGPGGKSHRD
jgi:iron(III) transport system substrate-binding protein